MSALAEVTVAKLDATAVEAAVRWYIEQGGGSVSDRTYQEFADRRMAFAPWGDRERIGCILAECPYRIAAGNPYNPSATVTLVERAVIADVAEEATRRQLDGCPKELTAWGWEPTSLALELIADLGMYHRLAVRCRAHAFYAVAVEWIGRALGREVYGDQGRGIRPDPSFLHFVTGG